MHTCFPDEYIYFGNNDPVVRPNYNAEKQQKKRKEKLATPLDEILLEANDESKKKKRQENTNIS